MDLFGRYVPVRAGVDVIEGFSVHADADELIDWLASGAAPRSCFAVHGTTTASAALTERIRDDLGWNAVAPHHLERVVLP